MLRKRYQEKKKIKNKKNEDKKTKKKKKKDVPIESPEVFPRLTATPQEDLTFDETTVAIDGRDCAHVLFCRRLANDAAEIVQDVTRIGGKRNGRLAALHGPLETDHGWMDCEPFSNAQYHGIFGIYCVFRSAIAFRACR